MLATLSNPVSRVPVPPRTPGIVLKALLEFSSSNSEGLLVKAVAIPWFEILSYYARTLTQPIRLIQENGKRLLLAPTTVQDKTKSS
jgi:hypothetical protein